ncbi:hypothetical protein T11_16118 [Trichinella zimbabwensis]|uniref:Uncharacterized protein n=1 Tax=Trichinella zimbabwensis TaxID=268475 RepID=A0A0V1HH63_9BILA|nr:hypothetical protein T11_16118 [Trichinella zimbabwensis]
MRRSLFRRSLGHVPYFGNPKGSPSFACAPLNVSQSTGFWEPLE